MFNNILTRIENQILTIVINRESKLNALNSDTLLELHLALADGFKNAGIGGIIITGAGSKAFVAGADIAELKDLNEVEGFNLATEWQSKVFNFIEQGTKPVIAAINGLALGGGLELALACHIRIASNQAKLGFPEVSVGLIPGYGGTQRLTQLVGRGRANELILTGESIDADAACKLGIVNKVVPEELLMDTSVILVNKILQRSPAAVAAAIRAINSGFDERGYATEVEEFSKCFKTDDFREGTAAFLEKRKPVFSK